MDAFEAARPKLDVEAELKHDITARRRVAFRALAAHHGVATQRLCALLGEDLGGGAPPAPARAKGRMPALDP